MEFVLSDANAQVRETFVLLIQKALSSIPTLGRKIIEEHALPTGDISPDRFISLRRAIDMLRQVQDELGPLVVRQTGSFVFETAEFPPQIANVEQALLSMNAGYQMNHQGNAGRWDVNQATDGSIVLQSATPYPREFARGLVEGICRNSQLAQGQRYRVTSVDGPPEGDVTCTIAVRRA